MSIEVEDTVVDEQRLGGARARLAFAVLVLERPRPVDRHHLAEVLWPDALPASWEPALRVVMSRVRAFLATAGLPAAEMLTNSYGCYHLALPDDVVVDVEAAAVAVDAAEVALVTGAFDQALVAAGEARAITGRVFIAGAEGGGSTPSAAARPGCGCGPSTPWPGPRPSWVSPPWPSTRRPSCSASILSGTHPTSWSCGPRTCRRC